MAFLTSWVKFNFWKEGNYTFISSRGKSEEVQVQLNAPLELTGLWNIKFEPATGVDNMELNLDKLILWNEHPDNEIKYFAGTAIYTKSFELTAEQATHPSRLDLGDIHDIAHIWINGEDLGIIWTKPWTVNLSGFLKEGMNELKIEVTNCWANRLIGDAALPEDKRSVKTNVRLVPDRSEYKRGHQATSADDPLLPSGLSGPVFIEFGQNQTITF